MSLVLECVHFRIFISHSLFFPFRPNITTNDNLRCTRAKALVLLMHSVPHLLPLPHLTIFNIFFHNLNILFYRRRIARVSVAEPIFMYVIPCVIWVVRLLEGWTNTLIDKGGDRMRFEKKKFLNVCFLCFLTSSPYEILTVLILYSPLTIDHLASYIYFSICLDCLPVFLQWFGWDWSNGLVKDA